MGLISSLAIFYCSSDSRFDESQLKVKLLSLCNALHNVNRTNNKKMLSDESRPILRLADVSCLFVPRLAELLVCL